MALKVKFRTQFPAQVEATSPILINKVGSKYIFGFDAAAALGMGPAGPAGPTGAGYGGTSATSLLIANTTTKTFTTQSGLAYQVGNYVRASSSGSSANYMEGTVSAYFGTTLSIDVTKIGGSGTFSDWVFAIAGSPGSGIGVSSLAGNIGDFTLGTGLKNNVNEIDIDPSFFPVTFGGRITALSGVPVPQVDVIGSQNIYLAPYKGKTTPTYAAATGWTLRQFTANATDQVGLTLALAGSVNWAADSIHDVFTVMDSGTLKLATRAWDSGMYPTKAQITNVSTITTGTGATAWTRSTAAFNGTTVQNGAASATIASPVNSGLTNCLGQAWGAPQTVSQVIITAPTDHYIFSNVIIDIRIQGSNDGTNWYEVSLHWISDSAIGATYTLDINTDNQIPYSYHRVNFDGLNGTSTLYVAQIQFMKTVAPAAGRRLTLRDGIYVNDASMTSRTGSASTITTAQYEGIYRGAIHIDAGTAGQVSDCVTWQAGATCGISNAHNKVPKILKAGVRSTAMSYTLTSQVYTPCSASSTFSLTTLCGLADDPVRVFLDREYTLNASAAACGAEAVIGLNSTSSFSGANASVNHDAVGPITGFNITARFTLAPQAGSNTFYALERVNNGAGTVTAFNNARQTVLQAEFMY